MKVLVVGGGGREHAIIKKLKENPSITEMYALPGNGGIASDATCVAIGAKDIPAIVAFAKEKAIDFAVVAPDDPLVLGAVDALNAEHSHRLSAWWKKHLRPKHLSHRWLTKSPVCLYRW